MDDRGIELAELAAAIDRDVSTLNRWKNSGKAPDAYGMTLACDELGVTPLRLFGLDDRKYLLLLVRQAFGDVAAELLQAWAKMDAEGRRRAALLLPLLQDLAQPQSRVDTIHAPGARDPLSTIRRDVADEFGISDSDDENERRPPR